MLPDCQAGEQVGRAQHVRRSGCHWRLASVFYCRLLLSAQELVNPRVLISDATRADTGPTRKSQGKPRSQMQYAGKRQLRHAVRFADIAHGLLVLRRARARDLRTIDGKDLPTPKTPSFRKLSLEFAQSSHNQPRQPLLFTQLSLNPTAVGSSQHPVWARLLQATGNCQEPFHEYFRAPPTQKKLTRQQFPHSRHQLIAIRYSHVGASLPLRMEKQSPNVAGGLNFSNINYLQHRIPPFAGRR